MVVDSWLVTVIELTNDLLILGSMVKEVTS
jgi:hypothetical protein